MCIGAPFEIQFGYVQRMMVWLLFLPPERVSRLHAMQLGLGAGAITKFCHKNLRMRTTAVELNPEVIIACRAWFRLPPDAARLNVLNVDAADVVRDPARQQTVDVLCVDLYDGKGTAPVLDDEGFYAGCRDLLAEGGLMTVNIFGRDANLGRSGALLAGVFGRDQVWSMQPTRFGNTILIAARDIVVPDRDTLRTRAATIEERWAFPARKWLRMLRRPESSIRVH